MNLIIVGGLIQKDNKFLLVKEANPNCYGKWNFPAGLLDNGETVFDGVKREVLEECNCIVEPTNLIYLANKIHNERCWIGMIFNTTLIQDDIAWNQDEILDVQWFSFEEILSMKQDLRNDQWIIGAIESYNNNHKLDASALQIIDNE